MKIMEITAIIDPVEILCPHCNTLLLRIHSDDMELVIGEYFLNDGETIFGLNDQLSEAQKTPNGYDYSIMVGCPPCCNNSFFVIEAQFADMQFQNEDYSHWFFQRELSCEKHFSVHDKDLSWIATKSIGQGLQISECKGVESYKHMFGPWGLEECISDPWGINHCCSVDTQNARIWNDSAKFLLDRWNALKSFRV